MLILLQNLVHLNLVFQRLKTMLLKKFDASLINDYYTKTKADEAIAGKINSFKASLKVGGSNLLLNSGGELHVTNNSSGERFISNYNIEGGSLKPSTEYTLSNWY